MSNQSEKIVWRGTPSQLANFKKYVMCALIFILSLSSPMVWNVFFQPFYPQFKDIVINASKILFFLPIILSIYYYLRTSTHRYTITTERLNEEFGILSKSTDVLELFRIKDITFSQPLELRVFGLGNIILDTSDKSTPIVVIKAVENGDNLISSLRKHVDNMRTQKGVREID